MASFRVLASWFASARASASWSFLCFYFPPCTCRWSMKISPGPMMLSMFSIPRLSAPVVITTPIPPMVMEFTVAYPNDTLAAHSEYNQVLGLDLSE